MSSGIKIVDEADESLPLKGLEIDGLSMNNMRDGLLSVAFIGNAIVREHYGKSPVSVFL